MAQHGGQAPVTCQMCEQSSQIKKKCVDCDYLLCANCCQVHQKIKELSDHQLVDLQDIGSVKDGGVARLNFKNIECRSHTEQKCCLFCDDCDKVVCVICISETHNQHKMIQISEGHTSQTDKIATWRAEIKRKIKTISEDKSTLETIYSTENSKYEKEKEKVLGHDKVLKEAIDTQTKTLVCDLDQRWYKINKSVKDEIIHAEKHKQQLQSREERLEQALESGNAADIFKTVEKEQKNKRSDLVRTVNLTYETLPTFKTGEINLPVLKSFHGSLIAKSTKTDIENIKFHNIESYSTNSTSLNCIKCNLDGTIWIHYYTEGLLICEEKCKKGTFTAIKKLEIDMLTMASTTHGDLLLSVGKSRLQMIPHTKQTITKSQYSVSPLVTTAALHVSTNRIIVGAKEIGPLYPASGPRKIIMMDTQGKHEKVYQFAGNNKPLFTNPRRVTMDSKNNVYVLDKKCSGLAGRVIIINNHTGKIIVYNGNPKVNDQDHPLTPGDLVATNSGNVVVSDFNNHLLHILNANGECVKYINTAEHGIKYPWSLDIDHRYLLHIGADTISRAELYVVNFTGF